MSRPNQRNQKSRPERLAQHHLAFLDYVKDCEERGVDPDFESDESMRFILRDQSGSHVHHAVKKDNGCDAGDPLRHLLPHSTICGAGSDLSVFRSDTNHLAVRLWPEQYLAGIMDEIDAMERAWHELRPDPSPPRDAKALVRDQARREEAAVLEELMSPTGSGTRNTIAFGPKRPLY